MLLVEEWEIDVPEFLPPATMKLMQRWGGVRFLDACSAPNEFHSILQELPADVVDVLCADLLLGDVLNGSFHQYFHNSFGITVDRAISAMQALGLPDHAEAARRALMVFGADFPQDRLARMDKMDELPETAFDEATDRFYAAEDSHPIGMHEVLQRQASQLLLKAH
ncbi:DMP19 family protein [Mesorhizobium sp. 113-3-3]|uniref:DMP19 family protein n=1 Tax=Mesorhizobium sp. 113-3-3 TaxID=2744516 RepID=UPI0019274FDA|nr:DUF4375 domain-containing protein [Mesorhizobium sp. 113-3-3]BCG80883.1 hypothetical protein MesoLj113b_44250 [Mesorhizobium sp. 113-3-3]